MGTDKAKINRTKITLGTAIDKNKNVIGRGLTRKKRIGKRGARQDRLSAKGTKKTFFRRD